MAKLDERIGFLGGGNMAFAIGYGLINRGIVYFVSFRFHTQSQTPFFLIVFVFFFLFFPYHSGIIKPTQVVVSGPNLANLEKWRVLGANITEDNGVVVTKCDIIFICVKPHLLNTCASQVESGIERDVINKDKLFVSVLAGVTLDQLELV